MPPSFLYMPLKVPPRNDLVKPLGQWLDDFNIQVTYGNILNNQNATLDDYYNAVNNNSNNTNDDPPSIANPMVWAVPKPEFSSLDCRKELLRLAALRNCLSDGLQESHLAAIQEYNALEDCQEYHATLLEFEKRGFPTLEDETNGIALTWKGAFSKTQQETHYTLIWDRACTLWNVAAFESYLGAETSADEWKTKEGCKLAISQFQMAASHLALLKQLVESSAIDYATVDMSNSMLSFWEKACAAQAQLSIYKMANLGSSDESTTVVRNHSTLAYLVQGAASLYNEALALAQDPRLQSEVPKQAKEWGSHCKAQSLICQSRALFHLSLECRQQKEHGMEIARLRKCLQQLKECQEFLEQANNTSTTLLPEVTGLVRLTKDRLAKAEPDNHNIYMEDIPNSRELPEIRSQVMVKTNLPLTPAMVVTKVPLFEWCKR